MRARAPARPRAVWLVHEQVAIAALDCGDVDLARTLIIKIDAAFPESLRAAMLKGMLFEAMGDLNQATAIYGAIVEENEAHQGARKRMVAVKTATSGPLVCAFAHVLAR